LLPGPEPFFGSRGDDFWAAWNSHTDKLTWARGFLALLMSDPAQEAAMRVINAAGADHLRKMRGLYVDYPAETVLLPENLTTEEARADRRHPQRRHEHIMLGPACDMW
jgi:hypothetical protein